MEKPLTTETQRHREKHEKNRFMIFDKPLLSFYPLGAGIREAVSFSCLRGRESRRQRRKNLVSWRGDGKGLYQLKVSCLGSHGFLCVSVPLWLMVLVFPGKGAPERLIRNFPTQEAKER
jgi:hypothetical protein